jgi:hypothetical protein
VQAATHVSSIGLRDAVSCSRSEDPFRGVPQLQQVCQTWVGMELKRFGLGTLSLPVGKMRVAALDLDVGIPSRWVSVLIPDG